ncbi:hypothetical protein [Neptunomonas concharum]|uniref:Uncharacterized protein n=1 Tax=Neptunomonas concharum TaxID=1031538 RepID=A0A5P1RD03_9GAMM|nr:hypothetical protein [Neptunomonas concharum]QEQ97131.1 hypothetical protein F0U83_10635 [Neptunomonas concharum]
MTEEEFLSILQSYSIEQLDQFQTQLGKKIEEIKWERARQKSAVKVPPRTSNDISKMAEEMGLDISSLMREISKR